MMFVFIPYWNESTKGFKESLANQTIPFDGDLNTNRIVWRNRRRDKIYWTKTCNDFYKQIQLYRGIKDDDVICIMNNDISFDSDFFEKGSKVKRGQVLVPTGIRIDWSKKGFHSGGLDCFSGRAFFMTYRDFIDSKGFCRLLPHYLSDLEFGIRQLKKLKLIEMDSKIIHKPHPKTTGFKILSEDNPIFWTIFLLKAGRNRYLPLNILKAWYDAI